MTLFRCTSDSNFSFFVYFPFETFRFFFVCIFFSCPLSFRARCWFTMKLSKLIAFRIEQKKTELFQISRSHASDADKNDECEENIEAYAVNRMSEFLMSLPHRASVYTERERSEKSNSQIPKIIREKPSTFCVCICIWHISSYRFRFLILFLFRFINGKPIKNAHGPCLVVVGIYSLNFSLLFQFNSCLFLILWRCCFFLVDSGLLLLLLL